MRRFFRRLLFITVLIFALKLAYNYALLHIDFDMKKLAFWNDYGKDSEVKITRSGISNHPAYESASSVAPNPAKVPAQTPQGMEQRDVYQQLNPQVAEQYQKLELQIRQALLDRQTKFSLTYKGNQEKLSKHIQDLVEQAIRADDYTAYVLASYKISTNSWGDRNTITIEAEYRESISETAFVGRRASEILSSIIKEGMNDHEKLLAVHDWLVDNIVYDESLTYYTAYDALTRGVTVCQGYSLLTYRLLNDAGIETIITEGEVNTGPHSWNMVKLDGQWYHLDVTWDDPVGGDGSISYNYYLVTDDQLRKDHTWTMIYPPANRLYDQAIKNKYPEIREHIGLHWYDDEHTVHTVSDLNQLLQKAIKESKTQTTFRYESPVVIKDALNQAAEQLNMKISYSANYKEMTDGRSLLVVLDLQY